MDLREIGDTNPRGHWYYETKYNSIFSKVNPKISPKEIVEIGAGSKFFIKKLLEKYPNAHGWAIDPNFNEEQLLVEDRLTSSRNPPDIRADMYLFLDVLEHVENDAQLLCDSIAIATKGAIVVISVPAFQHLWSGHDVYLGHFKRYKTQELKMLCERANLEIQDIFYTFSLIYPVVLLIRKLRKPSIKSDMKPMSPILNSFLLKAMGAMNIFNSNGKFGVTAVVIAHIK